MKKFGFALFSIFVFCCNGLAQTDETFSCPKVYLVGPSEISTLDKPEINSVKIIGEVNNLDIKYIWTVIGGEIIEGKGTSSVKVLRNNLSKSLTVKVEVSGLPKDCLNVASETSFSHSAPRAEIIDEFTLDERRIDKIKLDNLIYQLQKDPTSQAFIIEKFKRNIPKKVINKKTEKITEYLIKFRNQNLERFIIITDLAEENSTQLWFVPAGATPPKINNR